MPWSEKRRLWATIGEFLGGGLALRRARHHNRGMTKRIPPTGKAAIAGAIGSAAVAAALLYANRRKKKHKPTQPGAIPSGEPPETD